ncbi:hypothetical protein Tco_1038301 [Tanacetum coccineum]
MRVLIISFGLGDNLKMNPNQYHIVEDNLKMTKLKDEHPSSYFILANQSSCPQLNHEDLEQLDEFDLEEMDLKCCHKTGHFARECRSKRNQDSRRRDAWNTGNKDKENGRRSGKQEDYKALVTLDGEGVDWTSHSEDEQENYALMAYSSLGSNTEYEEKIRFMKIDLDDKTDVLTYHKKLLAEAEKEKEELKAKVEKWHNSSKNLNILLNSQMSARDKAGLGYGDQMNKGVLSYENEVFQSVFVSRTSDIEDSLVNDRYAEGMHAVPPPMIGIYIPYGPDKEIDDSQFTYGPKKSKPSESNTRSSDFNSYCDFHEKMMAKQAELNNRMRKKSSQREIRPIWNNVQRVNHQNQFVPKALLTRTGKIPVNTARTSGTNTVNTARHNFNRQAVPINAARKVNTVKPIVINTRPKASFHKSVSPFRKLFNSTTALRTNF